MEITFPIYKKEDKDHDYHTIDGLSFLTDDVVGKSGCRSVSVDDSTTVDCCSRASGSRDFVVSFSHFQKYKWFHISFFNKIGKFGHHTNVVISVDHMMALLSAFM